MRSFGKNDRIIVYGYPLSESRGGTFINRGIVIGTHDVWVSVRFDSEPNIMCMVHNKQCYKLRKKPKLYLRVVNADILSSL